MTNITNPLNDKQRTVKTDGGRLTPEKDIAQNIVQKVNERAYCIDVIKKIDSLMNKLHAEKDAVLKINSPKKQKFEEIKELALKLFSYSIIFNGKDEYYATAKVEDVWTKAKNFIEFTEQKEKEVENEATGS